jgi:RecJ-like exonuclease
MTCFGCEKPPYHARGLRQCLDELDRWAKKAAAIAAETGDGWMVAQMAAIQDAVGRATAEKQQPCPACNGSGWNPAVTDGMVPCEHCNGQGVVVASRAVQDSGGRREGGE